MQSCVPNIRFATETRMWGKKFQKQNLTNQQLSFPAHLIYKLCLMNLAKSITWVILCMQGKPNTECMMHTQADITQCRLFLVHLHCIRTWNCKVTAAYFFIMFISLRKHRQTEKLYHSILLYTKNNMVPFLITLT